MVAGCVWGVSVVVGGSYLGSPFSDHGSAVGSEDASAGGSEGAMAVWVDATWEWRWECRWERRWECRWSVKLKEEGLENRLVGLAVPFPGLSAHVAHWIWPSIQEPKTDSALSATGKRGWPCQPSPPKRDSSMAVPNEPAFLSVYRTTAQKNGRTMCSA